MTEELADFLLLPAGRTLLTEADALRADRADTLTALTRLRKSATPEQAGAAWEMADLRTRGQAKFGPLAAQMYFVREALEQASGQRVADYHAARMKAAGLPAVADLGGGIGGDALAFARAGLSVTLTELDPVRARFAAENAAVWGVSDRLTVQTGDILTAPLPPADAAVWLDPARRQNSRRVSDPEDYSPPLSWLDTLPAPALGVKLSPAIDHALAARYGAELEFLSEGGECREALLWRGAARSGDTLRATLLLPGGPQTLSGSPDTPGDTPLAASGAYLYEPDPAVIRAHLVGTLGRQIDAAPVDPHIAYLLGDALLPTPFAAAYEVWEQFPYHRKRLQAALIARRAGRIIIKKRGFPQEPEEIRKSLKLRGPEEVTVILARVGSGHQVYLCGPINTADTNSNNSPRNQNSNHSP